MTWHAESMAAQVFQIMYPTERDLIEQGLRHTKGGNPKPETPEEFGRTEMASFAASFGRALAGMSQVEALHLLQRSIQAAQQSHRVKVRSTRGRWFGHWLRSWLANERGKRSGPPEGGPPSGSTRGPRFA
jgi:hypothetical protein